MRPHAAYIVIAALFATSCLPWLGCGALGDRQRCIVTNVITPATASADHAAPFPSNAVTFMALRKVSGDCAIPAVMPVGTWSTSDAVNTLIDVNSGTATCIGVTPTPATIRFTSSNTAEVFSTATLTCR